MSRLCPPQPAPQPHRQLPAVTLAILLSLPPPGCRDSGAPLATLTPPSTERTALTLIGRVAPLLPRGIALLDRSCHAPSLSSLREQLGALLRSNLAEVPCFLRSTLRPMVTMLLAEDANGQDLIHELADALRPLDGDGDGVVTGSELLAASTIQLPARWKEFIVSHESTLRRFVMVGELVGWRLQ